jgi:integrase
MGVYKRGQTYWYKFLFQGQLIRESAKTNSKTVAREAERARRHELELAINRIPRRERMPLFSVAVREWLASRTALAANTLEAYRHFASRLSAEFGQRLVCDINERDIAALQQKRLAEGKSTRTVNFEINVLRQVLKQHGLWGAMADRVKHLRERRDVGRAISPEDEEKLLNAVKRSRSPVLLPLFVLSIDSGLRACEVRALRRRDLRLEWKDGSINAGIITVPKSKTDAGTGRAVPLTRRACAELTRWFGLLPDAPPDSYVFPRNSVGVFGNAREPNFHSVDLGQPIGEWKKAWNIACKTAGVSYRWHDCRHTFITRLAENPVVSEETIRALAGHVSRKMLERYSHIRMAAKQAAIAGLEKVIVAAPDPISHEGWAQNWAQSEAEERQNPEKMLDFLGGRTWTRTRDLLHVRQAL